MSKPRIVVVGGGAGGLPLVTKLGAKLGKYGNADITLVDSSSIHVWKPRFHEVATGAIDADLDAVDYRAHAQLNHYRFEPGTMTQVDTAGQTLTLAPLHDAHGSEVLPERKLSYDYLVLATGSQSNDLRYHLAGGYLQARRTRTGWVVVTVFEFGVISRGTLLGKP